MNEKTGGTLRADRAANTTGSTSADAGFSLIELLVVMIVLGVLAAIVVYEIGSTRGDAHAASCKSSVNSIVLAAEAFKSKNASYPATASDLMNPKANGMLDGWPGGTDPTKDDLVYAYSPNAAHDYTITISGRAVSGSHVVYGDATTAGDVRAACTVN